MSFISTTIFGLVAKEPEYATMPNGTKYLKLFLGVPPLKVSKGVTMCFLECTVWNPIVIKRTQELGLEKGDYAVGYGEMKMDHYGDNWYPKVILADVQRAQAFKEKEKAPVTYWDKKTPNTVVVNKQQEQIQDIDFDW